MADATALRLGANNGASDKNELFLKVFGGEVLAAFDEVNVMADKHIIRTIKSGKSAQFPAGSDDKDILSFGHLAAHTALRAGA